jgi:sRNA-binding carbon storage regulator CsrA
MVNRKMDSGVRQMLVITRKYDESAVIEIGGKVLELTISKVSKKDSVRLCFDGPMDFHIRRKELPAKKEEGDGVDSNS